jgi:kinesin family protein 11
VIPNNGLLCRRPRSEDEKQNSMPEVVQCDELHKEVHLTQSVNNKQFSRKYHFDKVYDHQTSQERLYETAVAPMVDEVLQGFNCTVFAYGQTGTGKTHTMTGDMSSPEGSGVIPRAVGHIFRYLHGLSGVNEFTVKCSFLELYNEEITDLLAMGSEPPKVRILEDRTGVVLQGLEEPHVKNASDIFGLLETGNARRKTAETLLNKQSSRSHSVFIVTVSVREVLAEGEEVIRVGKLYLVDLAGSENITRSGAVDQRAKEAGNINKSLLTLGRVITALVEGQGHVPYRDSKLTRLLRDSLGGRTKTCIIATIAPTVQCQEETMSTLDYAHRAKNIKNKPEVNQKISKTTHLKEMGVEIARLKAELVAAREKNGVYLPHAQYEEDCARMKEQQERIEQLEAEAEVVEQKHAEEKAVLVDEWESKVEHIQQMADELESDLNMTKSELAAAREDIAERDYIIEQQRSCENALASHATGLTKNLVTALSDVSELFARVDAKNRLEESNTALLSSMCGDTVKNVSAMDKALHAAVSSQIDMLSNMQQDLNSLSGLQQKSMEDTKDSLMDAKAKVDGMLETVSMALATMNESGSASIGAISSMHAEFHETSAAAAKSALKGLEKALKAIEVHAHEERTALEEMHAKHDEHKHALQESIESFVTEISSCINITTKEVESMKNTMENALAQQQDVVNSFKTNHAVSIQTKGEKLVEEIKNLVASFATSEMQDVEGFCNLINSRIDCDGEMTRTNLQNVDKASGMAMLTLNAHGKSLNELQALMDQERTEIHQKMQSSLEQHATCALEMHAHSSSFTKATQDALNKHTKSMTSLAKKEAAALASDLEMHQNNTYTAVENFKNVVLEELEDATKSSHLAQGDITEQVGKTARACETDISTFAQDMKGQLTNVAERISTAVEREYLVDEERHCVPCKRPIEDDLLTADTVKSLRAPSIESMARKFRGNCMHAMDGAPHDDCNIVCEEEEEENMAPNAQDDEDLQEREDCLDEPALPSPTAKVVSRKRSRSRKMSPQEEESPCKLKAAFEQGERRRRGRKASAI